MIKCSDIENKKCYIKNSPEKKQCHLIDNENYTQTII